MATTRPGLTKDRHRTCDRGRHILATSGRREFSCKSSISPSRCLRNTLCHSSACLWTGCQRAHGRNPRTGISGGCKPAGSRAVRKRSGFGRCRSLCPRRLRAWRIRRHLNHITCPRCMRPLRWLDLPISFRGGDASGNQIRASVVERTSVPPRASGLLNTSSVPNRAGDRSGLRLRSSCLAPQPEVRHATGIDERFDHSRFTKRHLET